MAAPSAIWTALDTTDWDAGDGVYEDKMLQLLQDIMHLATVHKHDGATASGGAIATVDPKSIWFYGAASGSPFA